MRNKIFIVTLLLAMTGVSQAIELADYGVGSRALSMGRAGVGFIDDAAAIFLNPAGITLPKKPNILSSIFNPMTDTSYITLAGVNPNFLKGSAGVGYEHMGVYRVTVSSETVDYGEHELLFSYARKLRENIDLGGSFKFLVKGYSKDIAALRGSSGTGIDLDLGLRAYPRRGIGLGILLQNILPSYLMGKYRLLNGQDEDIPASVRLGTSFKIWGENAITSIDDQDLYLAVDVEGSGDRKIMNLLHAGTEWWPTENFAFRGGYDQTPDGDRSVYHNYSLGFGIKSQGFTFDYAYYKYDDSSAQVINTFSIGFVGTSESRRRRSSATEITEKEIIKYRFVTIEVTPEQMGIKITRRRHFKDVPKNYWAVDAIELLATAKLLSGFPDDTFQPNKAMSRADFSIMMLNAKNLSFPEVKGRVFGDVGVSSEVARQAKAVKDLGAMVGYPDWQFKPFNAITRAEAVKVFAVFDHFVVTPEVKATPFLDVKPTSWAAPYIVAAAKNGFITSKIKFYPNKPLTRAEAASMLYKTSFGAAAVKRLPPLYK